jgi:hypothetical protein
MATCGEVHYFTQRTLAKDRVRDHLSYLHKKTPQTFTTFHKRWRVFKFWQMLSILYSCPSNVKADPT